jgi:hypothetical protein
VASDIPALVYVSSLDNETPVGWGALASEGFTARTLVEWRNIGHVAAAHDPKYCAGDIAAAFLADPSSPPDTSCSEADDYRIAFVLP